MTWVESKDCVAIVYYFKNATTIDSPCARFTSWHYCVKLEQTHNKNIYISQSVRSYGGITYRSNNIKIILIFMIYKQYNVPRWIRWNKMADCECWCLWVIHLWRQIILLWRPLVTILRDCSSLKIYRFTLWMDTFTTLSPSDELW